MKLIRVNLTKEIIPFNGTFINGQGYKKTFDNFKVSGFSGHRVYITMISDTLKIGEIAKKMEFKEGEIYIKFGSQKVCIGSYTYE